MSYVELFDRIPPCLCRLMATTRGGKRLMSLRQLASASGLQKDLVNKISKQNTWAGIPLAQIDRFTRACQVNLLHPSKALARMRGRSMWLTKASKKHQGVIARCLKQAQTKMA